MQIDINNEELLELALHTITNLDESEDTENSIPAKLAVSIVFQYLAIQNPECSDQELVQKIREMETGYILQSLIKKGMVDVSFNDANEVVYNATEQGRNYVQCELSEMDEEDDD